MKSNKLNPSPICALDKEEHQLKLIEALARHLAIELDYHYDDQDASKLIDEIEILTIAYETLKREGITAPDVVREVLKRLTKNSMNLGSIASSIKNT